MDWTKLKAEYIKGGTSYRKLAEKYNVPFGTLRNVAAKEKWRELRDKTRLKTDTKFTDAVSKQQADRLGGRSAHLRDHQKAIGLCGRMRLSDFSLPYP